MYIQENLFPIYRSEFSKLGEIIWRRTHYFEESPENSPEYPEEEINLDDLLDEVERTIV